MKYFLLTTFIFIIYFKGFSQHDKNWVLGFGDNGVIMTFEEDSLLLSSFPEPNLNLKHAQTSYSNRDGELLYYSNGCYINDKNHNRLQNALTLTTGHYQSSFCNNGGSVVSQSTLGLNRPGWDLHHQFFHYDFSIIELDTIVAIDTIILYPDTLFITFDGTQATQLKMIDLVVNTITGLPVVRKKSTILRDTLSNGYMQAVRHANGEDWWIIVPKFLSNCYFTFLLTNQQLYGPYKQCIGEQYGLYDLAGLANFSPDGNLYARSNPQEPLLLFKFDRCNGQLYDQLILDPRLADLPNSGVFFSPNSRFLYSTQFNNIFQYDLWASDIIASKTLIATWDGFRDANPVTFDMGLTGRDGKIYVGSPSLNRHMGVIQEPDSLGLACQFLPHSLVLPEYGSPGLPNLPNFDLGPADSLCSFSPFTSDNIILNTCSGQANGSIDLVPENGQAPYTYQWADTSLTTSSRSQLAPGFYSASVTDASGRILVQQFDLEELPPIQVQAQIQDAGSSQDNGSITPIVSNGLPPYTFLWTPGNQTDSILTDLPPGDYTLNITDSNGCTFNNTYQVGLNTSITTFDQEQYLKVFPNPALEHVQIEVTLSHNNNWSIQLIKSDGRLIRQEESFGVQQLTYKALESGVYWIILNSEDKRIIQKFVVL